MTTSQEWWNEVKNDATKFHEWLVKQHRGEVTAFHRIYRFANEHAGDARSKKILWRIAEQERQHAEWVLELLQARGIEPAELGAEDRYWAKTLPEVRSFQTGAAVGAHAEAMRLERIRVICDDPETASDVRSVFEKILRDEVWHEQAFRELAGPDAMEETRAAHEQGRELLGLEP